MDTHTHRVAAWEQPGATCTWTPELPSPGFTPHVQLTDTHTYTCTHTHTDTHTHIQLSDTHTEWQCRPGLWLPTGHKAITPRLLHLHSSNSSFSSSILHFSRSLIGSQGFQGFQGSQGFQGFQLSKSIIVGGQYHHSLH